MVLSVIKTLLLLLFSMENILYNSVLYDKDEMNDIECGIDDGIKIMLLQLQIIIIIIGPLLSVL